MISCSGVIISITNCDICVYFTLLIQNCFDRVISFGEFLSFVFCGDYHKVIYRAIYTNYAGTEHKIDAPSRVEYKNGCPVSSPLWGPGSVRSFSRDAGNAFWRIVKATTRSFLHLYALFVKQCFIHVTLRDEAKVWGGTTPMYNRP